MKLMTKKNENVMWKLEGIRLKNNDNNIIIVILKLTTIRVIRKVLTQSDQLEI